MIVDTRDKPCPEPVLMTKNALESPIDSEITILVDNDISKENVIKFLTSNHLNYSVIERTDYFEIKTNVQADKSTDVKLKNIIDNKIKKDLVYYITSESAGTGDCELGQILMKNMLSTLDKLDSFPETMIFINTGVYLTTLNNDTVT
jgi:selenium metabolism protein YedF